MTTDPTSFGGVVMVRCRFSGGPEICVNHDGYSGVSAVCPTCTPEAPPAEAAVDPPAADTGNPSPRDKS